MVQLTGWYRWRSSLLRGLIGTAMVGFLTATTGLSAQTLPLPPLPPEQVVQDVPPPKEEGAAPAPLEPVPQPRPRLWEYSLGAGVGWDGNIEFAKPDGPSGVVFAPRGDVARVFWSPRGQLRAVVGSRWAGYPGEDGLNRYYGGIGLEGEYRSGSHTTWKGDASYLLGHTDSAIILLQQGVALPQLKTRSVVSHVSLTQQVARRTSLIIDGRFYRIDFDSPLLAKGDASSIRGDLALLQQLGARSTGSIVYALEDVLVSAFNRRYSNHFASLRWTRLLTLRSAILLEGGVSYTPDAAQVGLRQRDSFFGGATYSRKVGASATTLFVRREVIPAFGYGISQLQTSAGLRVEAPLGLHWRLGVDGSHTQPDNVSESALAGRPPFSDARLLLARRLGKVLEVSAETRYRRRGVTSLLGRISSFQAGLYLSFTPPGGAKLPPGGLF